MEKDQEEQTLPKALELGIGMLPDPWRDRLYSHLLRFAGRRVAPELVKQFTEEADAARARAILSDTIAAAGAEVLSSKIKDNPELAALALARSMDDGLDRQENLHEILRLASAQLVSDVSSEQAPPEDDISEDWRRKFTRYAEDVSDDQMQTVWSRILSGEVQQPGTFSFRTLRLVSELSPEIAKTFEELAGRIIAGDAIVTLGGEWNEGELFMKAKSLCDWGITQEGPPGSVRIANKQNDGIYIIPSIRLHGGLRIPDGPDRLNVPIMLLTDPGKELYKLLPETDERPVLREILQKFVDDHANAEIAQIVHRETSLAIETVFQKLQPTET